MPEYLHCMCFVHDKFTTLYLSDTSNKIRPKDMKGLSHDPLQFQNPMRYAHGFVRSVQYLIYVTF